MSIACRSKQIGVVNGLLFTMIWFPVRKIDSPRIHRHSSWVCNSYSWK